VTNVAIVVTRYFGGVKLGAGGLAKAYASSVKLALDAAGVAELIETEEKEFTTDYKNFDALKHRLEKEEGGEILAVEYGETIIIRARMPKLPPR
jgi:putative IMPACT (imprinted ancient) family translation regulator